jgi:hypothetical protein
MLFGNEKQLFWGDDCTLSNLLVRFRESCQGLVTLIEQAREGVEVLQPLNSRNCQPDQNVRAQSYRPLDRIYVQFPALTTNNDPTKLGIGRVNGHVPEERSLP